LESFKTLSFVSNAVVEQLGDAINNKRFVSMIFRLARAWILTNYFLQNPKLLVSIPKYTPLAFFPVCPCSDLGLLHLLRLWKLQKNCLPTEYDVFETKFKVFADNGSFCASYILHQWPQERLRSSCDLLRKDSIFLEATDPVICQKQIWLVNLGYVNLGVEVGKPKNENNKDDWLGRQNRITDFKKSAPGTVKAEDVKAIHVLSKDEEADGR